MPTNKELAVLGARQRVVELQAELADLYRRFPSVRGGNAPAASRAPRARTRKLTAAQKKAIGVRMRKFWAAKRAEKSKAGSKKKA
jgi:hypothetical protein